MIQTSFGREPKSLQWSREDSHENRATIYFSFLEFLQSRIWLLYRYRKNLDHIIFFIYYFITVTCHKFEVLYIFLILRLIVTVVSLLLFHIIPMRVKKVKQNQLFSSFLLWFQVGPKTIDRVHSKWLFFNSERTWLFWSPKNQNK